MKVSNDGKNFSISVRVHSAFIFLRSFWRNKENFHLYAPQQWKSLVLSWRINSKNMRFREEKKSACATCLRKTGRRIDTIGDLSKWLTFWPFESSVVVGLINVQFFIRKGAGLWREWRFASRTVLPNYRLYFFYRIHDRIADTRIENVKGVCLSSR